MNLIADNLFTVANVLSASECSALIERSESLGFQRASVRAPAGPQMRADIRDNDRAELNDVELAAVLWLRCSSLLTEIDGTMPAGIDVGFRFYRYDVGQRFKPHKDGSVTSGPAERSRLSFLVYLNSDFTGGETIFYSNERTEGVRPVIARIAPDVGLGLLFRHDWWHEGAPLIEGRKYVLRTDVFYKAP